MWNDILKENSEQRKYCAKHVRCFKITQIQMAATLAKVNRKIKWNKPQNFQKIEIENMRECKRHGEPTPKVQYIEREFHKDGREKNIRGEKIRVIIKGKFPVSKKRIYLEIKDQESLNIMNKKFHI